MGKGSALRVIVTEEEGEAIGSLVKTLEGMSGAKFSRDPLAWERMPPQHHLTPSRIRQIVRAALSHLTRRELLEERFLAELTIAGRPFLELEAELRAEASS